MCVRARVRIRGAFLTRCTLSRECTHGVAARVVAAQLELGRDRAHGVHAHHRCREGHLLAHGLGTSRRLILRSRSISAGVK